MAGLTLRTSLLRRRKPGEPSPVTNIELFFDLVFVFAVTQLSHALLARLTPAGAVENGLLFIAVWWVWIDTSWCTNWLDPNRPPVRLMLLVLMLAGLVLSAAIPRAFADRGLVFAGAHIFIQVGRSLFMLWALAGHSPANFRNFQRITVWLGGAAVFWLLGGVEAGVARFALWLVALGLEFFAPLLGFWVPGFGRSTTADWDVEGAHMAERCAAFILIALGESITVTGAAFAELAWSPATIAAFVSALAGSVAMWWIYFDTGAARASRTIAASGDPGRLARTAYTYIHMALVAGIIVAAVADDLALARPMGAADLRAALALLIGPALYLLGVLAFKRATVGRVPLSHLIGVALFLLLVPVVALLSRLALSTATTAILIIVAAWETAALRRLKSPAAAR